MWSQYITMLQSSPKHKQRRKKFEIIKIKTKYGKLWDDLWPELGENGVCL